MNPALQNQFKELEKKRIDLFDDLKAYDDAVINKKPLPEAWSITQVIEHLIKAEEQSLLYLQKKTQDTSKVPVAGLGSSWRFLLTRTVFLTNIKYKAPQIVVPADKFSTVGQLETKWAGVRKSTFGLLNSLPEEDLKKEIWKHAIAGKMNISQMLAFFDIHFSRHRKQINRTLAQMVL